MPAFTIPYGKLGRVLASAAALSVGAAACMSSSPRAPRAPAGDHAVARAVAVDTAAGRWARTSCTAHELRGATGFWQVAPDSVGSFDRRVVNGVDSLFARLRSSSRFEHLGSAADYHRQYLGIWFDGKALVYVHGVDRSTLQRMDIPLADLAMEERLVSLCDGGTGVFGLLLDPTLGALGRIEFGQGFAGAFPYDDIVPPEA